MYGRRRGIVPSLSPQEDDERPVLSSREERRNKEEEKLKMMRLETAKRRKQQQQMDAELKEKKEREIEKALKERKERTATAASNRKVVNKKERPSSAGKLPSLAGGMEKKDLDDHNVAADVTRQQIRHLNVLESLDLHGVNTSTDMFLLAERISNRASVRASEAASKLKLIEQVHNISHTSDQPKVLESPSNKTKRVRIQVVERTKSGSPEEKIVTPKLPSLFPQQTQQHHDHSNISHASTSTTNTDPPNPKPTKKQKKKPEINLSTGMSIDIEKIEKDIALIDKALLEKYQNLRHMDTSATKQFSPYERRETSSVMSQASNGGPKKKSKIPKPIFSNRVRKF